MTTKRRKFFAIVLLLVIGVIAYGLLKRKDEPKYQGRYLSEWLEECSRPSRIPLAKDEQFEPEIAVRSIGTNALPCLMQWLAAKPAKWQTTLQNKLPAFITTREPVAGWLDRKAANRRKRDACLGLQILGTNAVSVIPELLAMMKGSTGPEDWYAANVALAAIGEPAIPSLKAILADPNQPNRDTVIDSFNYWSSMVDGHGTNVYLPIVIGALDDNDIRVRSAATNTLGGLIRTFKWFTTNAPVIYSNGAAK